MGVLTAAMGNRVQKMAAERNCVLKMVSVENRSWMAAVGGRVLKMAAIGNRVLKMATVEVKKELWPGDKSV
jgi:hypothetical protein